MPSSALLVRIAVVPLYVPSADLHFPDITASCDVSEVEVEGKVFNTRIQGGVLADGLNSLIGALATVTPTTTFAQVSLRSVSFLLKPS